MKYFIVADIHGFYNELKKALETAGFDANNPEHTFVSLGDVLDRGKQPREMLEFIMSLPEDRRILIRGNHEDLMEEALSRWYFLDHDIHNGTRDTVFALAGKLNEFDAFDALRQDPLYKSYIASCIDYYETEHAIFVHGWIPHNSYCKGFSYDYIRHDYVENWREADKEQWKQARWFNGMDSWADGVREPGKTIFCGHWHTAWGRAYIDRACSPRTINPEDFLPWVKKGIVALDACTALTGFINCYVLTEVNQGGHDES